MVCAGLLKRRLRTATGGVGLGLAVVRCLVLAHGGSVTVESNPASGTCFRVSVPATGMAMADVANG